MPQGFAAPTFTARIEQYRRDGITPPMPPNPAPHVIDRLIEIGLTEAPGLGAGPLTWMQIEAWARLTGIMLEPWEARLIRRLSGDYLAESRKAEDLNCPPPWRAPVTAAMREAEAQRLVAVLG